MMIRKRKSILMFLQPKCASHVNMTASPTRTPRIKLHLFMLLNWETKCKGTANRGRLYIAPLGTLDERLQEPRTIK